MSVSFHTAPSRTYLMAFASAPKFKARDAPQCTSKTSSKIVSKDMHRHHLAAAAYTALLLVGQVAAWLTNLSTDPSQVRDIPGILSSTSNALQDVLVAEVPFLSESIEWAV